MEPTLATSKIGNDDHKPNPGMPRAGITESSPNSTIPMGEALHQVAASAGQSAADAASYVGRKAEDAAAFVGHKTDDAVSYVGQKTNDASAAVGDGLRSLGNSVRERGPSTGVAGDASASLADSLESGGRYLQEEGIKAMADDVTNLVRRNPIPALLLGVAAGYLVARATTPRS